MSNFDNPEAAASAGPNIADLEAQLAAAKATAAAAMEPAQTPAPEAAPAQTAPIEPEVVPAATAPAVQETPQVDQQALANAQAATFLSAIPAAGAANMGALVAATESDDTGSGTHLFPILTQQSGNTGGAFVRAKHMSATEAANLPEGMKPFTAVFLGYRFVATAWSDDGQNSAPGASRKPVFSCALGASEAEATNQLMTIGKEYQFTSQAQKPKYDVSAGGPGHIRPQIELLVFDPEYGELFIFQTCSHYNSAKDTRDQLLKNATTMSDGNQSMLPFIGVFSPETTRVTTKGGRDIAHHFVQIDKLDIRDNNAQAAWATWQKFGEQARQDQSIMDQVNKWFAGEDAMITKECRQALHDGVGI